LLFILKGFRLSDNLLEKYTILPKDLKNERLDVLYCFYPWFGYNGLKGLSGWSEMPRIFRTRFIPSETLDLSKDVLHYRDQNYLITEWLPINPREDIAFGISCVFLQHGWKISAILDREKKLKYWYCDIMEIVYNENTDTYHLYDLLTDVRILPDGTVEVIDLDELAMAYEQGLITSQQLSMSLRQADSLLRRVYGREFPGKVHEIIREFTNLECHI